MIVTPAPVQFKLPPPPTPRSRGVHVSGLIRGIAIETGKLEPEQTDDTFLVDVREITDPVAILRICIGLAWEEWYINHILGQLGVQKHPGEMCVDGVYMSPDGISQDVIITQLGSTFKMESPSEPMWARGTGYRTERLPRIHEVKATYKSTNTVNPIDSQWMWLTQIKAYCKGAGTRYACIHPLCLCGNYKMPIVPVCEPLNLEFTQREIEHNWDMLMEYRGYREGL